MEQKKRKTGRIILGVALAQLVLAVALMVWGVATKHLTTRQSNILVAVSLLIYWLLTDILEPVLAHRFDGITPEQKNAYYKFMGFDLVGLGGICYFLFSMGGTTGSNGILGAAIYALTVKIKRDNQDIFYGRKKAAEDAGSEKDEGTCEAEGEAAELPEDASAEPQPDTQAEEEAGR